MKAVIAEDEANLRRYLRKRLAVLWPQLQVCGEAQDGDEALAMLHRLHPDVAFLDIRMPGKSGLEVARLAPPGCRIVFITAYDQFAVEAFERAALDYLLKPVEDGRLLQTIQRLQHGQGVDYRRVAGEIESGLAGGDLKWIRASLGDIIHMLHVDDVICFRAESKYVSVLSKGSTYVIRTPLKELESQLDPARFWRIHRATIINVDHVDYVKRLDDGKGLVYMKQLDEPLTISRAHAHLFKQM